jgi:hypothetical protein
VGDDSYISNVLHMLFVVVCCSASASALACAHYAHYKKSGKGTTFFSHMQEILRKVCFLMDFASSLFYLCSIFASSLLDILLPKSPYFFITTIC